MKKKTANIIMVLFIAAMVFAGVVAAFMMKESTGSEPENLYTPPEIQDNTLIEPGQEENTCTISILCNTILDNMGSLSEEKAPYVPKDGIILSKTTVSFADEDTVFDVLKRVCEAADIQIEYSYTPMYKSYYIEGINHLYEFDCGPQSGWMYSVNGQFPNYGCSAYKLSSGDDIVWCYTCSGLGADVGADGMG